MRYFDDNENFDTDLLKVIDEDKERNTLNMYADLFNRYVEVCNENDVLKNKVKVLETTLKDKENGSNDSGN